MEHQEEHLDPREAFGEADQAEEEAWTQMQQQAQERATTLSYWEYQEAQWTEQEELNRTMHARKDRLIRRLRRETVGAEIIAALMALLAAWALLR